MDALDALAQGVAAPGVYRLMDYRPAASVLGKVSGWGWHAGYVDGKMVVDKPTFLDAIGQALDFPDYAPGRGVGKNWDAFEEMIRDLTWLPAPGYVILFDHVANLAATRPGDWQTALAILQGACRWWDGAGVPCYVLLRHSIFWNRQIPKLVSW